MFTSQIWAMFPKRGTLFTIVLSGLFGAILAVGFSAWLWSPEGPSPSPSPPHDPHFAKLGHTYLPELGKAYAKAWEDGAKVLDAGQNLTTALNTVAEAWSTNRTQIFDKIVTPEFGKVIAESKKDADITPLERSAIAAAWRGFAIGLKK